jgi:hypothetical protein
VTSVSPVLLGRTGRVAEGSRSLALSLVLLTALASPCAAASKPKPPPPRYNFAGVPWLVEADSALAQMVARGYQEVPAAKDRDKFVCRGKLFEHEVLATGHLDDQHRLVRWVVLIGSRGEAYDWPDMRRVFDEVVHENETRYGSPRTVIEKYRFPYERGDSREDEALRDGKLTIRWAWASRSGDRLSVEMDRTAAVVLTYEAPEWAPIEARRRAKKASDL